MPVAVQGHEDPPPLHLSAEPMVEFVSLLETRFRLSFLCLKFFLAWLHLAWLPRVEAPVHPCLSQGSAALSSWSGICSLWSLQLGLCVCVLLLAVLCLACWKYWLNTGGREAHKEHFALAFLKSKTNAKGF